MKLFDGPTGIRKTVSIGAVLHCLVTPHALRCQQASTLNAKSISFLANGTEEVFAAPPSDITPGRVLNNSAASHIAYNHQVAGKRYAIDFIPLDVACTFNMMVQCPEDGAAEQLTLATYVSQTIPKLASGTLR